MHSVDLSSVLAGIKFKNPVISGGSELAHNLQGVKRLIDAGVGGITTKTHTTVREVTYRPRPYQMPLRRFGEGYEQSGGFLTMACPDPYDLDLKIKEELPRMADACKRANIPFIISFFCHFDNPEEWGEYATRFEKAGADMLELNFSCPDAKKAVEENIKGTEKIIQVTAGSVKSPVGLKIGLELEPLEKLSKIWVDAGAQFIAAHNAPNGILIDTENEIPFGFPNISCYIPGRSFVPLSVARIIRIKQVVDIPIIGIGGIYSGNDALQYILSGCPVVLICTAVFLRGTKIIKNTVKEIQEWMERKGYKTPKEFEGKIIRSLTSAAETKTKTEGALSVPPETPYFPLIYGEHCTKCGDCWNACDAGAIRYDKRSKKVVVDKDLCWSCGLCVGLCEEEAITLVSKKNKDEVIWDVTKGLPKPFKKIVDEKIR
ncbi:MAG: hypothetical protein A2157_04390 [Deltaproteobacteria bacterium RBG_16_47_11]|nr:MAG: hypothetical protein A2157_04390 [Deltaproteobacteria bacterium RBG_16_47_11]